MHLEEELNFHDLFSFYSAKIVVTTSQPRIPTSNVNLSQSTHISDLRPVLKPSHPSNFQNSHRAKNTSRPIFVQREPFGTGPELVNYNYSNYLPIMPSHMPSSFASAAAGQSSSRDSRNGRGDGRGSGDWYVAS